MTAQAEPFVLGEVGRDHFLDSERFRRITEACLPVVIRSLVSDWPVARAAAASTEGLRAYLLRFASPARAEAFVGDAAIASRYAYAEGLDGFNFERIDTNIAGALDRIFASAARTGAPSVYLGSLEAPKYLPGFAEENALGLLPSTVHPRIWIGNASNIACHNDTFDNIACVVAGRRRFTLYPPDALPNLYIGPVDFTMAGRPVSLAACAEPDDARYPGFVAAKKRAMVVDLGPGDALYLPKLWWHEVDVTEPVNMLVNYWWDAFSAGPDAPNTAMMLAMIAIAERPPAERAAWRAMFDHYVFRPDGHPLRHVVEEKRGILGPLKDNYGRIRAMVMQTLRGG